MEFPIKLRDALVEIANNDDPDDIYQFTVEQHMWSNTSMGLGSGFSGQAFTGGWIVTLERRDSTDVWHVSNYGYAILASSTSRF